MTVAYSEASTDDSSEPDKTAGLAANKSYNDILNRIDLICADMDGTLLSPNHNIPDITFNRINKADQNGCLVIPATGGSRASAAECFSKGGIDVFSRPGIYLNGAVIYDHTGAVAAESVHAFSDVAEAAKVVDGVDNVVMLLYSRDRVLSPCRSEKIIEIYNSLHTPCPEDCGSYRSMLRMIEEENIPVNLIHFMSLEGPLGRNMVEKIDAFAESTGCYAAQSLWRSSDVVPAGVNKGLGVKVLKQLGYDRVACIGDAMNDYEMLKKADVAVAMGNALPEIKKIASIEVNPNSDVQLPGVADLIDRILAAKGRR